LNNLAPKLKDGVMVTDTTIKQVIAGHWDKVHMIPGEVKEQYLRRLVSQLYQLKELHDDKVKTLAQKHNREIRAKDREIRELRDNIKCRG